MVILILVLARVVGAAVLHAQVPAAAVMAGVLQTVHIQAVAAVVALVDIQPLVAAVLYRTAVLVYLGLVAVVVAAAVFRMLVLTLAQALILEVEAVAAV